MSSWVKQSVMAATVASAVSTTLPVAAADVFIKMGDIKGESTDAKHKGEIDALAWSWGTSQTRVANSGAATGRVMPQDLLITKPVDSASPQLLQMVNTGRHLAEVVLSVRIPGKSAGDFIRIKLKDVFVASVKLSFAPALDRPMEEIALSYASIEFTVTPTSGAAATTTAFNYVTMK